jgi:hypothetical protein
MMDLKRESSEISIFCCENLENQIEYICEVHNSSFECADNLIYYSKISGEFGLIIHDGGSSFVRIEFCPFCVRKIK